MEPEVIVRKVSTHGELTTGMFGLSGRNTAHLINILRSSLYTAKELAVLREYSTNAWDAHVEAGIPDRPFKVVLPTIVDPTLTIRDYGLGMAEKAVYEIYALYGESTKRESNKQVGYMGIGSKSAFCYSDTFTITSFHGGFKTVYLAVIDESNIGQLSKVHESPCAEDTGIEIRVPVNPQDVQAFHRAAEWLFQFFDPLPAINIPIKQQQIDRKKNGFVLKTEGPKKKEVTDLSWVAVMGCVPYRLNFSRMLADLHDLGLEEVVKTVSGGLFFDIGEVSVSASREELEYTARTRSAVVTKLRSLFTEVIDPLDKVVDDPAATNWEKRLAVCQFITSLDIPLSGKFAPWANPRIMLIREHERDGDGNMIEVKPPFRMGGYYRGTTKWGISTGHSPRLNLCEDVCVTPETRLIIRDKKQIRGYSINPTDRIISPLTPEGMSELERVLAEHIAKAGLEGIPVVRLSDLPQNKPIPVPRVKGPAGPVNIKHKQQFFVLKTDKLDTGPPLSANWNVVERVPQDDDVYVILSHFIPNGKWGRERIRSNQGNFYRVVSADRERFALLGVDFPTIYGVKTTVAKPIDESTVKGVPYSKWRMDSLREGLDQRPDIRAQLEDCHWTTLFHSNVNSSFGKEVLAALRSQLPEEHPLVALFRDHVEAKRRHAALPETDRKIVGQLASWQLTTQNRQPDGPRRVAEMLARYPLLDARHHYNAGFRSFAIEGSAHWFEYVNLIDNKDSA